MEIFSRRLADPSHACNEKGKSFHVKLCMNRDSLLTKNAFWENGFQQSRVRIHSELFRFNQLQKKTQADVAEATGFVIDHIFLSGIRCIHD